MEKEFNHPAVAQYFNKNFVNIRVNMEKEKAIDYELEYQVVFLPTMIFVTPDGTVLSKLDRIAPANELLSVAKFFNDQHTSINNPAAAVATTSPAPHKPRPSQTKAVKKSEVIVEAQTKKSTSPPIRKPSPSVAKAIKPKVAEPKVEAPKPNTKTNTPSVITDDEEGTIVHIMGQDLDKLPPEILKKESYFRIQLMDGSHHKTVDKYLASQDDWSTDENIVFIHDFIYDARSDRFKFLIANRADFERVIGADRINQTINILVNKELERGYPRPDYDRAVELYGYTDRPQPVQKAQVYHLNNLYEAEKISDFIEFVEAIGVETIEDAATLCRYSSQKANKNTSRKNLKNCMALAEKAISSNPESAIFHLNKAQIAFLQKNSRVAKESAYAAKELAGDNKKVTQEIQALIEKISLL